MVVERREKKRRISDDCSQCEIWTIKIAQQKRDMEDFKSNTNTALHDVHTRIDGSLPWKVFLMVIVVYLGISGYNAIAIKGLSIDVAKVQTKIESVEKSIVKVERSVGKIGG